MGIAGAAIASVIAEASSIVFFLIYTYVTVDFKKYGLNQFRTFNLKLLTQILNISCFTMLQYFLSMATWFAFFAAVERLGQRDLAIANIVRSIYIVMMIPVSSLATTANSLVSNTIGSGKLPQVMPLIGKISRMSFLIMLVSVGIIVLFKEQVLAIYTNEVQLINESGASVLVIGIAMLVASVSNILFSSISGTGNTRSALMLETITLVIYIGYVFIVAIAWQAPVEICFTTEILYYVLLLVGSYIYLKKAKWQNKKI